MNAEDRDLLAVREAGDLIAGTPDEPSDEAVARTWRMISLRDRPRPRAIRPWLAVPAAAAAVAAVVTAVAIIAPTGGGGGAVVTPAEPSPPGGSTLTLPPLDFGRTENVRSIPVADAMAELIAKGQTVPATPLHPGQFIYVVSTGVAFGQTVHESGQVTGQFAPELHQMWVNPQGMFPEKIIRNLEDTPPPPGHEMPQPTAVPDAEATLLKPTPAWIAGLPTETAALRELLRPYATHGSWSFDHYLMGLLGDFFWTCQPLLTPQLRVAFYQVLAGLNGLTASEMTIQGRRLYAIRQTESVHGKELLFDPASGLMVGRRDLLNDGGQERYVTLWQQKLVDQVGQE